MTNFRAETYQNEYLATGATHVDALVSVTASDTGDASHAHETAELVMVDVSGSMNFPRTKIKSAITATCAAVDCIRDGVLFAVIAGTDEARVVYPSDEKLVAASPTTRQHAKDKIRKVKAGGGTAIGSWLGKACALLADHDGCMAHALLLTDGENQNETPEELVAVVAECEGVFQCDCRGVGADWVASELRTIASGLLGTVEAIREPGDLAADFAATMERAMSRGTGNVALRVWTPVGARVDLVQQVSPTIEELTHRRSDVSDREGDYPTGAWSDETREYHVSIEVPAREIGDEMLAGRIKLVVNDEVESEARIRAIWTDDAARSTQVNAELAHYTGQAQYASAIDGAYAARKDGDPDLATHLFGQAVAIASQIGDTVRLQDLAKVVDIDDAATGTVRLKQDADPFDDLALAVDSVKTNRLAPSG
jgi:von Willebrand factor type A domain/von Willebrand factor type A C-terminal domain